jgi:alpha-L-fucosidase
MEENMPSSKDRLLWFNEQRFGMFIHWGLYSIPGMGEWYRYHEAVPPEEYHALGREFNPRFFRPK